MRILLIAGGWSSEREVSLSGAEGIAGALAERGHSVLRFDPALEFDALLERAAGCDAAFINLHGAPGEDGLIQGLLDRAGCPYQGAGPAASFLALHKTAAKQLFRRAGLRTPDWEFLPVPPSADWRPALPCPLFAKANTGGSSLGLARVEDERGLRDALRDLFAAGEEVLLETAVSGQEATCGVLGEEALPPVLIQPLEGSYFNYKSKYRQGGAKELCPAPLPEDSTRRLMETALAAHRLLGIEGYSRADFILPADGMPYILEVNTLPGMTATSLIPQEAAAVGLGFGDLLERLLELGMRRKK
ncbi:MAG: D-alanine--D-alanine ligase [Deltaproteobacteria bacterium]|jgi:D-alanine-D-alanine ligase|nr:D-alanine--D-alanine ligase [Deltaproteobacteria bacterium]